MPYQIKEMAGKVYEPSNGSEGAMFQAEYCAHCVYDASFSPCPLVFASMAFPQDNAFYPSQYWVHDEEGRPKCEMFTREDHESKEVFDA